MCVLHVLGVFIPPPVEARSIVLTVLSACMHITGNTLWSSPESLFVLHMAMARPPFLQCCDMLIISCFVDDVTLHIMAGIGIAIVT